MSEFGPCQNRWLPSPTLPLPAGTERSVEFARVAPGCPSISLASDLIQTSQIADCVRTSPIGLKRFWGLVNVCLGGKYGSSENFWVFVEHLLERS